MEENWALKRFIIWTHLVRGIENKDKEMVAKANVELGDLFAQAISKAKREAQIEVLTEIFQACYQEDSRTLELVEEKLSKLKGEKK